MDPYIATERDPFRYSVLIEVDDSEASTNSSRCASQTSFCSYDERFDSVAERSPFKPCNDDLDESIVNGIRDLDIGTQKENAGYQTTRNRSNTFKIPDTALHQALQDITPTHTRALSNNSSIFSDFYRREIPRPASPSLLLGHNPNLRDIYNQDEIPEPAEDYYEELRRHSSGQYQAVLLVPIRDKNHLIADLVCEDTLILRDHLDHQLYYIIYGISLVRTGSNVKMSDVSESKYWFQEAVRSKGLDNELKFANVITLLATRLKKNDQVLTKYPHILQRMRTEAAAPYPYSQVFSVPVEHDDQPPSYAEAVPSSVFKPQEFHYISTSSDGMSALQNSNVTGTVVHGPRIEDSVEALDKLEDDIDAIDVQFNGVMMPSRQHLVKENSALESKPKLLKSVSTWDNMQEKYKTISGRPKSLISPQHKLRRSSSVSLRSSQKDSVGVGDEKALHRRSVAHRPTSLLPPKPVVKSSKPPTQVEGFALKGAEVSRRIKEQREARFAAKREREEQAAAQSPTQKTLNRSSNPSIPTLRRAKSTKRLTIPNFELPGEAISRRKKLEQEEQIRRQEEEERKAREFKARPVPASIYSGSQLPRSSIFTKAQGNGRTGTGDGHGSLRQTPKRSSVVQAQGQSPRSPITPRSKASNGFLRGRPLSHQASIEDFNCSLSSSNMSKRNSISFEDLHVQRVWGKEILAQDNQLSRTKENERERREIAAKLAREEAAERSRRASREWAEKQKRKQATAPATIKGAYATT